LLLTVKDWSKPPKPPVRWYSIVQFEAELQSAFDAIVGVPRGSGVEVLASILEQAHKTRQVTKMGIIFDIIC
jgi:hypothetical protein